MLILISEDSVLDVGCGNEKTAKGTVNVDFFRMGQNIQMGVQLKGEHVDPHEIPNFVVADACHLPFRDNSFNMAFSNHTIEHVEDPFAMYFEMCRVAKCKIVVRCPHKRGSGAKRPFHLHSFDEKWFKQAADKLRLDNKQFVTMYDYVTNRVPFPESFKITLLYRAIRRFDRHISYRKLKIPFELEAWSVKDGTELNAYSIC